MKFCRRLVWWKCAFWVAVGSAGGAVVGTHWPEVRPPVGSKRVTAERFAVTATGLPTATDGVTHVVLYPAHDHVSLITFDFRSLGTTEPAYAFGAGPFLTGERLRNVVGRHGGGLSLASLKGPALLYATTLRTQADQTVADLDARPQHQWVTAADFLDHLKSTRRGFEYATPWWADSRWQFAVPMSAGAIVVGLIGMLLTRQSVEDVIAMDVLRNVRSSAPPGASPQPPDLSAVVALDALLEQKLLAGETEGEAAAASDEASDATEPAAPAMVALATEPIDAPSPTEEEQKSYAGQYYPVREPKPKAFSLIELLVSIGIIGVLIALLLPTLVGARRSSDTIACAANLRSIGQGTSLYLQQNQNTFPAAYEYIGQQIINGKQTPTHPSAGYVHWSSYLYSTGSVPTAAFTCPAMRQGGLPPTNTPPSNRDPGQVCPSDTIVDQQAPRLAYTVNEVLCPRNKFVAPSFGADRFYRFVKVTDVAGASSTILATEMADNAGAISYGVEGTGWIMSHRPISGFVGNSGELDMYLVPQGQGFHAATRADIDADPASVGTATRTRLDLVGRNHGKVTGYPDRRPSNFLYVDGHVETKSVFDTVQPFEWGQRFYSLVPNDDQVAMP